MAAACVKVVRQVKFGPKRYRKIGRGYRGGEDKEGKRYGRRGEKIGTERKRKDERDEEYDQLRVSFGRGSENDRWTRKTIGGSDG
jgi:hypothetical protein